VPAPTPLVVAHRGAWGERPQNSLAALEHAISLGCEMVEFDVRRTRDEQLVLVHDERIRGVRVGRLDYADLAVRSGGGGPPRLEEALELIAGRIDADIELKEDGCVEAVVAALRGRLEAARFRVTSFLDSALLAARRAAPELNTGLLLGPPGPVELARQRIGPQAGLALGASRWSGGLELRVRESRVDFVAPHTSLARAGILGWAAERGLESFVWTVNDPRSLRAMLADDRVTAVITDRPAQAIALRDGPAGGRAT
jgi:glycerophosphoryl diester phosphodiesterase